MVNVREAGETSGKRKHKKITKGGTVYRSNSVGEIMGRLALSQRQRLKARLTVHVRYA